MREAATPNSDAVAPQGGPSAPNAGGGSSANTAADRSAATAADAGPPAAALPLADAVPPLGAPVSASAGILAGKDDICTITCQIIRIPHGNWQFQHRDPADLDFLRPVTYHAVALHIDNGAGIAACPIALQCKTHSLHAYVTGFWRLCGW